MRALILALLIVLAPAGADAAGCDDAQFAGRPCTNPEGVAIEVPAVKNLQQAFDDGDFGGADWSDIEAAFLATDDDLTVGDGDANTFSTTYDWALFDNVEAWGAFDLPQYSIPETIQLSSNRTWEDTVDLWRIECGSGRDAGESFDDDWLWTFDHLTGMFSWQGGCTGTNQCWQSWGVYSGAAAFVEMLAIRTNGAENSYVEMGTTTGPNKVTVDEFGSMIAGGSGSITANRIESGSEFTHTGQGQIALDTTDRQIVIRDGASDIIIPTRQYQCVYLELDAAFDGFVWVFDDAVTITQAWCRAAVDVTTEATFELSTSVGGGNMTMADVTCQELTDTITKTPITAGGGVAALAGLVLEVTNTPSPDPQEASVCFEYLTTRE
jgi:hypothetical protein